MTVSLQRWSPSYSQPEFYISSVVPPPPHTLHLLPSLTHYTSSPPYTLHLLTHYTSPPHTLYLLSSTHVTPPLLLTNLTQGCQHVCHAGREASIPLPSPWHKAKTETPGADHSGTLRIPWEGDGTFVTGGNGSPLQAAPAWPMQTNHTGRCHATPMDHKGWDTPPAPSQAHSPRRCYTGRSKCVFQFRSAWTERRGLKSQLLI